MRGSTYVTILLDRSGSMKRIRSQTVSGYNQHVQGLLEDAAKSEGQTYVSLITFNGRVKQEFFLAPSDVLREMSESQYVPDGSTALYEAIGVSVENLEHSTDINDEYNSYLVLVFSDGENTCCHKTWTQQKIAEKIESLEKTNRWTFTFVGANQDIRAAQNTMNLQAGNTMSFAATPEGTREAFATNARQMKSWLNAKDEKLKSGQKGYATKDYFGDK